MAKNYAENYPKIIYKYRSWANEYHKNILLKNQVYLSSPIEFNDPFDCKIPKNFLLIDSPEKIEKYVNDVFERQNSFFVANSFNIENEKLEYTKSLENIQKFQKEKEEIEFTMIDNHYGVLCMSAKWNSILMWSHYGDYHKGFCVGFNEEKMRESGLFGKGGLVTYSENFPVNELPRGRAHEVSVGRKLIFSLMKTLGFQTFLFTHEAEPRGILFD